MVAGGCATAAWSVRKSGGGRVVIRECVVRRGSRSFDSAALCVQARLYFSTSTPLRGGLGPINPEVTRQIP